MTTAARLTACGSSSSWPRETAAEWNRREENAGPDIRSPPRALKALLSRRTCGSPQNSRTSAGNPTSPTIGSPPRAVVPASMPRSSAGPTTTPATPCASPPTPGSPARSWSRRFAKPLPSTAFRPPRSLKTAWSTPPHQPGRAPGAARHLRRCLQPAPSAPLLPTPGHRLHRPPQSHPSADRTGEVHHRVRTDKVDHTGVVTLRVNGRLHHIGIGRTHARTHVLLLIHDLHIRVVDAATGELLRELTLDPTKDYQPTGRPPGPAPKHPK